LQARAQGWLFAGWLFAPRGRQPVIRSRPGFPVPDFPGLSLPERTTPQQRAALAGKCRKFVADWPGSSGERAALALLGSLGQAELDDALARLPANLTPDQGRLAAQQLRMMRKRWEGTPAAGFFDAAITRLEQP
jgi:hypothetical protein